MNEDMKVVIRGNHPETFASKNGFTSSDDGEPFMKLMFGFLGLPYEETFACCAIEVKREKQRTSPLANRPGLQAAWKPAHSYGTNTFVLDDATVELVRLVCAGDFQNVVCSLLSDILDGKDLETVKNSAHAKRFQVIPEGATLEQVKNALRWAHNEKGKLPYAEARLFQPVRESNGSWLKHGVTAK